MTLAVATDSDIDHWLARLRNGDEQAAAAIYRGYFGRVQAFVSLHVADGSAVEEIVDDTFLAAFASLDRFEQRSRFTTWLIAIAKNKSRDWLRQAIREPSVSGVDDQQVLENMPDPVWPALEHVAAGHRRAMVRFCVRRLPLEQREVTYLVFFEDLSVDQTAARVRCPAGTVKSRLFHARLKLADCLKRRLQGEEVTA